MMIETASKAPSKRLGWVSKLLLGAAALVLGTVVIAAFWINSIFSAHPKYNISIAHPALANEVTVQRDAYAIPHIQAQSEEDAFFALGYVHAQDRFWQMTLTKHFTQGRLTELFGDMVLDADISARTLNLQRKVDEAWPAMPADDRARVEAYAAGVNAWLQSDAYVRPAEMRILGLQPEAWTVEDSLFSSMSTLVTLTGGIRMEAFAESLKRMRAGGEVLITDAYPRDGHIALELGDLLRTMDLPDEELINNVGEQPLNLIEEIENSNNWVVSGDWTESGAPLLAGDPHLPPSMPGIWYLARVNWDDGQLAGGTVPGVPVIYMGLTNQMATSATISVRDTQDVYIETINPDDASLYLSTDGWVPFEVRQETFQMKSGDPVVLDFRETINGPVLPAWQYDSEARHGPNTVASFAWTALRETPNLTLSALIQSNRAKSVDDWLAALCGYVGPDVNIAFAHTDGTVGVLVAGRAPNRKQEHESRGRLPSQGGDPKQIWEGIFACDQNAVVRDPESGVIATANARVVPDGFPYRGEEYYAPPGRQQRIEDLIRMRTDHSIETFARIQTESVSLDVQRLLDILRNSQIDMRDANSPAAILTAWDGDWAQEGAAPVIFMYLRESLAEAIFADEIEDAYLVAELSSEAALAQILESATEWCDDVTTDAKETCDDVIATAFERASEKAERDHGKSIGALNWHELYSVRHPHSGFSEVDFLDGWFSKESRRSDGRGVPAGTGSPNLSYVRKTPDGQMVSDAFLPSLRLIVDLEDLDRSVFAISSGQSGHFRSRHYDDIQKLWARGEYVTMPRSLSDTETVYRATLSPSPKN